MRQEDMADEAARQHFEVGLTLFRVGRYADAAREFEAAYGLSPRSVLLFNAYLAYRDAGDLEKAVDTLRRFLEAEPDDPERERLEVRLRAMEASLERDRAEAAAAELERQRLEQEAARVAAENERLSEEAAALREQVPQHPYLGPWLTVAGGGALILGSGVAALVTNARQNDLDDNCPNGVCPADFDLDGAKQDVRRPAITTDVLLFTGIGVAAGGLVWYFLARRDRDEPPPASAACSPHGCQLEIRGTF